MGKTVVFPTFNISDGKAIEIVKYELESDSISIETKVLAIDHVAHLATHNSVTKDELVNALRWLFDHYEF